MKISAAMVKSLREKTGVAMMDCKKALQEAQGDIEKAIELLRKAGKANAAKRGDKTAAEGVVVVAVDAQQKTAFMAEVNSETDFVARDQNFVAFAKTVAQCGLAHKSSDVAATLSVETDGQSLENMREQLVTKIGENIRVRRVALLESAHYVNYYCHGDRIGVLVALDKANEALAKDIAMHIAASNPQALNPQDVPDAVVAKEHEIFMAQAQESGKPKKIAEKMVTGRIQKFLKEVSLVNQPFVKDTGQSVGELLKQHNTTVEAFIRFEVGEGVEKESQDFAAEVIAQVQGKA